MGLLDSGNNSDLVIHCQGEDIKVHRIILSARSPVFSAMLESGMLEEQKGRVKIEDAEVVILKELLRYLYTGKIGPDFREYKELMILANKYDVEDLMDDAGSKILETLTEENALELGIFGETHNSNVLLNASAKIIQENPSVETLPDGWDQQLEGCPRLMVAIIGALKKKGREAKEFARFPVGPEKVIIIIFIYFQFY